MHRLLATAFGVLLLAGCGKSDIVKEYEAMEARLCACKDMACIEKANPDAVKMSQKYAGARVTKDDAETVQKSAKRAQECVKKIASGGAPAAPATAPAPEPGK